MAAATTDVTAPLTSWRVDVTLSSSSLRRVLRPKVLVRLVLDDGTCVRVVLLSVRDENMKSGRTTELVMCVCMCVYRFGAHLRDGDEGVRGAAVQYSAGVARVSENTC